MSGASFVPTLLQELRDVNLPVDGGFAIWNDMTKTLDWQKKRVFDIQDKISLGPLTLDDPIHNNAVAQFWSDAAEEAGGGTVFLSPREENYRFRPDAVAGIRPGTGVRFLGCGPAGKIVMNPDDVAHANVVGTQTLRSTPTSLLINSALGFAGSGAFIVRDEAAIIGSYSSKSGSTLDGLVLTGVAKLVGTQDLSSPTLIVSTTNGFAGTGTINIGGVIIAYTDKSVPVLNVATGVTTATFTGCTGGSGVGADGANVIADSTVVVDGTGIGQVERLFQNKDTTNGNDDVTYENLHFYGAGRMGSAVLTDLVSMAIRFVTNTSNVSGPTGWCHRGRVERCLFKDWSGPQVHAFNVLDTKFIGNHFDTGWRGGIVGGSDSHIVAILMNTWRANHDDCINWQARSGGGTTSGATFPTRYLIAGNIAQEADATLEGAILNNGITTSGGQFFAIVANNVEGSDDTDATRGCIKVSNLESLNAMFGLVAANKISNSKACGVSLVSGQGATTGLMRSVTVQGNGINGTLASGIAARSQSAGGNFEDCYIVDNTLTDCGGPLNAPAIDILVPSVSQGAVYKGVLVDDNRISGAYGNAIRFSRNLTGRTLSCRRNTIRNPNRSGAASTDAILFDCSAPGVTVVDADISGNRISIDNGNSVRFGITLLAGANGTDVNLYENPMIPSQFANGAYSVASGGTRTNVRQPNRGVVVTLADVVGTIAVDASAGDYQMLAAGGSRTIGIPTAVFPGYQITFEILNNTGGAITTGWNAIFKKAGWADPAPGFRRTITFRFNGTNWVQVGNVSADL